MSRYMEKGTGTKPIIIIILLLFVIVIISCAILYFNKQKERVGYYFDISLENGVDEESNIPYYSDLYLDIAITNGDIEVLDEDELEDALKNKAITKKQYDLANSVKDNLLKSIKNNNNNYYKSMFKIYPDIVNVKELQVILKNLA